MDLSVVGAGRVGTALAVLLRGAGHRVVAVAGRDGTRARAARHLPDVPVTEPVAAARAAEATILGVPDDRIAPTCAELASLDAFSEGGAVIHLSGSVPLLALGPARAAGSTVLSLHPLQTVPGVDEAVARLPGSGMAVTAWTERGYALGERLARDAGGVPFRLEDRWKPLYHAAAVFSSNYLTVLAGITGRLFRVAGIEDPVPLFLPMVRTALENVARLGPGEALTGPAVRGDVGTVRRNLEALGEHAPVAVPAYVALARLALEVADRAGRIGAPERRAVEEELAGWS
jgi:predicted short-subunit dehydrogenase-like oxidoreductase (DUF2520 family)